MQARLRQSVLMLPLLPISFDASAATNQPIGELDQVGCARVLPESILEKILKKTWKVAKVVKVASTSLLLGLVRQRFYCTSSLPGPVGQHFCCFYILITRPCWATLLSYFFLNRPNWATLLHLSHQITRLCWAALLYAPHQALKWNGSLI